MKPNPTDATPDSRPDFRDPASHIHRAFTAVLRDLNKLNTFVRAAEHRSFTKAALELRTKPSVVSKRIKELEESLGFRVLNRSTHGLVLTDAGHGLFRQCQETLRKIDDYVTDRRNIETGPFGTLRVQAPQEYSRFVLAPLASRFVHDHPGVRVHLSAVAESNVAVEEGFDVVIAAQKPQLPGIIAHDLGSVRHVICAAPDYFRRFGRPKTPQDLREHNCLIDQYSGPKGWPFKNPSRPLLVEAKGSLSSNGNAVLIRMALDGFGIIRAPLYSVKAEIAEKRLEVIFRSNSLSPERMSAYCSRGKPLPAKTSNFVKFLVASLRGARRD